MNIERRFIGGNDAYFVKFTPQEDITTFELAQLIEFISVIKQWQGRVPKNLLNISEELKRHFIINDLDA